MDIFNRKKVEFLCTVLEQRRQDFIFMESKLLSEKEGLQLEVDNLRAEINYLKQKKVPTNRLNNIAWKPYLEETT